MSATEPSGTSATLSWPVRRIAAAKDGVLVQAVPPEGRRTLRLVLHERHKDRARGQRAADLVESQRRPRQLRPFGGTLFGKGPLGLFLLLCGLVDQRSRDRLREAADQQVGKPLASLHRALVRRGPLPVRAIQRVSAGRKLVEHHTARPDEGIEHLIAASRCRQHRGDREVEPPGAHRRVGQRDPLGQVAHREEKMIPTFALGVQGALERGIRRAACEVHLGERYLRAGHERMGRPEYARALADRLLEARTARLDTARAGFEHAPEFEHLWKAVWFVTGAGLVEDRDGLVGESQCGGRLTGLRVDNGHAGQRPRHLRVGWSKRPASRAEHLFVQPPSGVELALGRRHVRQTVEAACDERVVGAERLRPQVHGRAIQTLGLRPVSHPGRHERFVECGGRPGVRIR